MAEERYKNMLHYTLQIEECRSVVIERYFGDKESKPCGVCDICLQRKRRERNEQPIEERIIELLTKGELSVKECIAAIGGEEQRVVAVVDKMVRESKISLSSDSKLKIIE
jgi:ATP-dependent DNA helicase RecQ